MASYIKIWLKPSNFYIYLNFFATLIFHGSLKKIIYFKIFLKKNFLSVFQKIDIDLIDYRSAFSSKI